MSNPMLSNSVARQVASDHLELIALLQRVEQTLSDARMMDEARQLVRHLAAQLEIHFLHEEEGGYFREIAFRTPQLARLATSLEREHPRLLRCLREIEKRLASCAHSAEGLARVAAEFRGFATAIKSHEEDEHRLLQESVNSELGCND